MPPVNRGARMARQVLAKLRIDKPAVPVEKIAAGYARIIEETLPDDVSGMLVPLPSSQEGLKWVIVVNRLHPSVRRRFTIAHELGHLLLHRYTTAHADGRLPVRFRDEKSSQGSVREEIEANQFAAELLMPEALVRAVTKDATYDLADDADDDKAHKIMKRLAKRFEVSVQAFAFRVANLSALNT
jgi:Zn-dependent peptidase ImmA (M78 family)